MKDIFFTSSAANYFPKVKVLFDSIRAFHPDATLVWLVAEERRSDVAELAQSQQYELIFANDLKVGQSKAWLFGLNIVELSTALKPYAAEFILDRFKGEGVIYLDPDTVIFRALGDVSDGLLKSNVILTPHLNKPEASLKLVMDNELCALQHGVFNLGFFAVKDSKEGRAFLSWWQERLYHFCFTDLSLGVFTDQKWINFAPVFFEKVWINKDPSLNLAPWNIAQRKLSGSFKEGFNVDGKALGFYHFTGFDSGAHLTAVQPYINDNSALKELVEWYTKITRADVSSKLSSKWELGFYDDGSKITGEQRKCYRESSDLQTQFPNPYSSKTYLGWFLNKASRDK